MNAAVDIFADQRRMYRERHCKKSPTGADLCPCGVELSEDDFVSCPKCKEASEEKAKIEALQRRHDEEDKETRAYCDRAFEAVPDWEHVKNKSDFESAVPHKGLRNVGGRWSGLTSLALFGPSGIGKSSAALHALHRHRDEKVAAVLALSRRERQDHRLPPHRALSDLSRFVWTTASQIVREVRGHRLGSGECDAITQAVEAPLLVIDELGPENAHYIGEIFDIIDRRYAKKLPTVVTSGLTAAAFAERYGDAMLRRLTGDGIGHLVDAHPGEKDGS